MTSDNNKSKRQLFPYIAISDNTYRDGLAGGKLPETYSKVGCLPLIHGKITTSPASRVTRIGTWFVQGDTLGMEPSIGPSKRLSRRAHSLSQTLMVSPFVAGAGKDMLWYVVPLNISVLRVYCVCQFHYHRGD